MSSHTFHCVKLHATQQGETLRQSLLHLKLGLFDLLPIFPNHISSHLFPLCQRFPWKSSLPTVLTTSYNQTFTPWYGAAHRHVLLQLHLSTSIQLPTVTVPRQSPRPSILGLHGGVLVARVQKAKCEGAVPSTHHTSHPHHNFHVGLRNFLEIQGASSLRECKKRPHGHCP